MRGVAVGLLLRAVDVRSRSHWRWLLTDEASAAPLADHTVDLSSGGTEAEAFTDLYRYLRWNADPADRVESEARLLDSVGRWAGSHVLGSAVGAAIAAAAPVTVRVEVPAEADFLLFMPLELAHVGGVPLARRGDVSLVFDVGGPLPVQPPTDDRLRMVAVFSLPTETTALGLRRERYELARMVRGLAARARRMVELEVLQYGVTRESLMERMTFEGGPDVLHLSGHGNQGTVLLEKADGRPDPVETGDLIGLLKPAAGRLRLVVLSACQSAAASTAETLRWLQLDDAAAIAQAHADAEDAAGGVPLTGLARGVAQRLGCAVVAMRYPVEDDFAIALAGDLYEGLFALGLPVDAALRRAVPAAAGTRPSAAKPAVSIATPTLLGSTAAGLRLTPRHGTPVLDPAEARMAAFLAEPERFVGRTAAMTRAGQALASASLHSGVLFHGMAGAGKTACALELAYGHQNRFATPVWWQAPLRDEEWAGALTSLALALEAQLSGFTMVDKVGTADSLRRFLPRLRALLRDNGVLLVLDNLETLLTPTGGWRDPRWADLMQALTSHGGESRLVLTSRIPPGGLSSSVLVEPVHALSRDETVLLARELPNLRALLHAEPGPTRDAAVVDADRARVKRVLHLVQGHPKLLELADRAAADPATLAAHLQAAEDATTTQPLAAFLTEGQSSLDSEGFLTVLAEWTTTTVHTLSPESKLLLQLLAGAEDNDRWSFVLDGNWVDLRQRLDLAESAPDFATTLSPLTAAALVDAESTPNADAAAPPAMRYRIHPGVAEAVRAATPGRVQVAVDTELAAYWLGVLEWAKLQEGGERTQLVVRAGLASAPYLLRLHEWEQVSQSVQDALVRDQTAGVAQIAVAHLRRVANATQQPNDIATLGRATIRIDRPEGERLTRDALKRATVDGDSRLAAIATADLINLLRESGRLREALDLADHLPELGRQAGVGPWTQLGDRCTRLQILYLLGQPDQVLVEIYHLIDEMTQLPDRRGPNETVDSFSVRETVLSVGVHAARDLQRWREALDLNARHVASLRQRDAGAHAIAFAQAVDYAPLLRLGRLDECERLLLNCQQVFEDHGDIPNLGKILSCRADLAQERGRVQDAIRLEHASLRLEYTNPDPDPIASSHHNLANYLAKAGADPVVRLAHRLASATFYQATGQAQELVETVQALARDLRELPHVPPPSTIAAVASQVQQVEGVRFAEVITVLAGDTSAAERALTTVLETARSLPISDVYDLQRHLARWEPRLITLVAAVNGDPAATAAFEHTLTRLADTSDWANLAAALRRILAGDRDLDQFSTGLDPIDTAIIARALDALAGRVTLNATPAPEDAEDPAQTLIAVTVAAARGDQTAVDLLAPLLDEMAAVIELASLALVLRRIIEGERDPGQLLPGLDDTDTEMAVAILAQLPTPGRGARE
jgi:hypothetical protein